MKKYAALSRWISLFLLFILVFGGGFVAGDFYRQKQATGHADLSALIGPSVINKTKGQPQNVDFSLFWDVWNRVASQWDGDADQKQQLYGAIEGSLASLGDPYTVFFDPESAKAFNNDLNGKLSGIGAEITQQNGLMTVMDTLPDSPAYKAGLKVKDIIVKIDDAVIDANNFGANINQIRGQAGTAVHLTVLRPPSQKPLEFQIVRQNLHVDSLSWSWQGNIVVGRMRQFSQDTGDLMRKMAAEATAKHAKGLVLDLRGNPGGYLQAAQEVWGVLSPKNPLVIERSKRGDSDKLSGQGDASLADLPLVVLVDDSSASASEILAGAVQDYGRGKVVGIKTFGKGSVQDLVDLAGAASLKVTVAHWFTPNGRGIDKAGITPDVLVPAPEQISPDQDPVMAKALELLKS